MTHDVTNFFSVHPVLGLALNPFEVIKEIFGFISKNFAYEFLCSNDLSWNSICDVLSPLSHFGTL
jgi:hypothetical protein